MGAGTGGQIAAVLDQLHSSQVDFPVALHCVFHRVSGFCEGGRIQDDYVEFLALLLQLRKQLEHVGAYEGNAVGEAVYAAFHGPG